MMSHNNHHSLAHQQHSYLHNPFKVQFTIKNLQHMCSTSCLAAEHCQSIYYYCTTFHVSCVEFV